MRNLTRQRWSDEIFTSWFRGRTGQCDQICNREKIFGNLQQLDANIIYPKVVGSTTGLHPLFVLLAVAAAGSFFGIPGMILAVPAAGILQVFILKWAKKKEASS